MTTPKQPATEALLHALAELRAHGWAWSEQGVAAIKDAEQLVKNALPSIEAEAAAGLLALREALERVVGAGGHFGDLVSARNNAARVLVDTAPAATELEVRIRANEREQVTQALYEMGFEIDDDVDDRLTKRLADYARWRDRDREQSATEEAGE
jgi:hypothetical protein